MRKQGWYDRPGVHILEGRWQDILKQSPSSESVEPSDIGKFDIVYFDTFQEGYTGHLTFVQNVPRLLRGPGSRFSYYNGHCILNKTGYKVANSPFHPL
jgi:type IV protein arginine methyltransferase